MTAPTAARLHGPSLATGLALMLVGTVYPLVFAHRDGHADHGLAMLIFWSMSAGFVRGVGFIPQYWLWRLMFSGWACTAALAWACLTLVLRAG